MVDTADSKSAGSNTVRVQVSPGPPLFTNKNRSQIPKRSRQFASKTQKNFSKNFDQADCLFFQKLVVFCPLLDKFSSRLIKIMFKKTKIYPPQDVLFLEIARP